MTGKEADNVTEKEMGPAEPEASQEKHSRAVKEADGAQDGSHLSGKMEQSRQKGSSRKDKGRKRKEALAQAEVAVLKDRLLRLQADFDNFRKRTLREKDSLYKRANEDLMAELLSPLDHLDMALDAAGEHGAPRSFIEGFQLVKEQVLGILGKFGLSVVDADDGEFDFNLHEAISHLPSDDVAENCIISQVRRGYKLGDLLLRPAQVVVSSGHSPADHVGE